MRVLAVKAGGEGSKAWGGPRSAGSSSVFLWHFLPIGSIDRDPTPRPMRGNPALPLKGAGFIIGSSVDLCFYWRDLVNWLGGVDLLIRASRTYGIGHPCEQLPDNIKRPLFHLV